ncbi:MAG: S8 family serine peptidase [Ignavibacteriaceae bacterium]|nr:S8 family serine peptidase [Ignavibacteriaceae bacterium]
MNKIFTIIVILISTMGIVAQPIHNLDPYNPKYASKTIIVKFKDGSQLSHVLGKSTGNQSALTGITSIDELSSKYKFISYEKVFKNSTAQATNKMFKDHLGQEHEVANLDKIYKVRYDSEIDPKQLVELLKADANVDYAEPDYIVYSMLAPDDSLYQNGDQWYLNAVDAPAAWDITIGDTTQIISILDTGVDWLHPDLINKIWTNPNEIPGNGIDDDNDGLVDDIRGWDFINNRNDPMDDNSHGTHVAGIAAAESNNGKGIAGIAWKAKIMPVKVLQSSGEGNMSDVAAGVIFAANHGATVINMSLGSYGESLTLKNALANAYHFATLVAAAGNDESNIEPPIPYAPLFPACYSFVLGVMASNQGGGLAGFSNYDPSGPIVANNSFGHNYEVEAPGVAIWSAVPHGGYKALSGTSMAAPIVSGTVALMRSFMPQISNEEIFAKLIQSSNSGILNIKSALDYQLSPDLYFVKNTIVDTLPGADRDGIADVGETIEIYPTINNAGGTADSVWAKLSFSEFEDKSTAAFIDSISYLGRISTYAQLSGDLHPWKITINPNLVDNRIITFTCDVFSGSEKLLSVPFKIKVQKIFEVKGMITQDQVWSPDKIYVITDNTRVIEGVTLQVKPGTIIQLYPDKSLDIRGLLKMIGKPDSLITITSNDVANLGGGLVFSSHILTDTTIISYINYHHLKSIISASGDMYIGNIDINNSIFTFIGNNNPVQVFKGKNASISRCNFFNNYPVITFDGTNPKISENLFYHNYNSYYGFLSFYSGDSLNFSFNTVIDNQSRFLLLYGNASLIKLPNNYWGTTNEDDIKKNFYDFNVDATLPLAEFTPVLARPSVNAHGHVWKVLVNNKNPQEEVIDPVGVETVKFDVYFNRAMEIKTAPFLTFGVREPFTQNAVAASAQWNADSTIWTAYYNVTLKTGDGINTIRVAQALDNEHFEIPDEFTRFKFVVQAAGALSNEFNAYSYPGKIMLEWLAAKEIDVIGYNMYRYENITDSTFTNKIKINKSVITDTVYTDTNISSGVKYHYLYSVIGTDLQESDLSKEAVANGVSTVDGNKKLIPDIFALMQNYPNPFNPSTLIRFALPLSSIVKIEVYNILGEKIKDLLNEQKNAGYYEVNFNTNGLSSGIYFYTIQASAIDGSKNFREVKKMILMK